MQGNLAVVPRLPEAGSPLDRRDAAHDIRGMMAKLRRKGWLLREWEITFPAGVLVLTYSGRGIGFESVRVNGRLAVKQPSRWWFTPRFDLAVADQPASIEVRVWPWLALRAVRLRLGDDTCYTEGFIDG